MIDETPRQLRARRGFSLAYQGKTLLSLVDPVGQAERAVNAVPKDDRTLYLCPSPLYGYGLSQLLAQIQSDSAVLCVEIDEQLMEITRKSLDPSLFYNPRFRLVRTKDPAALCAFVRDTWGSRLFRRVIPLRLTGGWQLASEDYQALTEALQKDFATDWGNAMTLVKLGRRYHRNALRNLVHLSRSPGIEQLHFGQAPTLVLGAGPSLDGLLPRIKAYFGNNPPFKIICVDTALGALKSWGLKPDLAVALESQHWNLKDFIGLGSWKIPLAMDLSALPATADIPWAEKYFFFTPWTRLRFFDRLKAAGLLPLAVPPLGSVGLTAVSLARSISAGIIITGGLDFSYFPEAFHARDTPGHRDRLRLQTRLRPISHIESAFRQGTQWSLNKTGERMRTDPVLLNYRDLFLREFSEDPRIMDLAGSGLHLGIPPLEIQQALHLLEDTGDLPEKPAPQRLIPMEAWAFVRQEIERLRALRVILTGEKPAVGKAAGLSEGPAGKPALELEVLLDDLDYLWAHFPDCAGREGGRPPLTEVSFLKRVRVEIDPALKLLEQTLRELEL